MKPEDYLALESFIRETGRRFDVIGKAFQDFHELAKSNRDKIELIMEEFETLYGNQAEHGTKIKDMMQEILITQHNIEELKLDFDTLEETTKVLYDVEQDLKQASSLKSAVDESMSKSTIVQNDDASQKNDEFPFPLEEPITPSLDESTLKYSRDDLMAMDWNRLRNLAFGKFKCTAIQKKRPYYVDYIMEEQIKHAGE